MASPPASASPPTDIIKSAAKFLETPAQPERPLEEKIRFLIKEKKLSQYQLIAALKQANLYSADTIESLLRLHYFEQHSSPKDASKRKKTATSTHPQPVHAPLHPQPPPVSQWSPWWSTLSTIGVGVASFLASYTVSTTASQNLVTASERKTEQKLDSVKSEIKEQADLDRERQHRDLMEVVALLKTQVACVQQNLGVLKQSIEVIQTQMKYNNLAQSASNANMMAMAVMAPPNIRTLPGRRGSSVGGDDHSVISSAASVQDGAKPNLGVIGQLLAQNDDGLDWMKEPIKDATTITASTTTTIQQQVSGNEHKNDGDDDDDTVPANVNVNANAITSPASTKSSTEAPIAVIYHPDYKDMIKTLPTDIKEIKQQLTDLLNLWQKKVATAAASSDEDKHALSADRIKAGLSALTFYINKILKKPLAPATRKINTYNKQYKERLSTLPRIDTLLTLIGYEQSDAAFWTLPLLYQEHDVENQKNDEQSKRYHERQIEFLSAFKTVLANLFNVDGTLPRELSEAVQRLKRQRESELQSPTSTLKAAAATVTNATAVQSTQSAVATATAVTDNLSMNTNVPQTKYSNKFQEIAAMVAQGKTPDDVQKIDDMPPDPHAPPTESVLSQPQKPFESGDANEHGLSWFEQYEAQQETRDNEDRNESENVEISTADDEKTQNTTDDIHDNDKDLNQ